MALNGLESGYNPLGFSVLDEQAGAGPELRSGLPLTPAEIVAMAADDPEIAEIALQMDAKSFSNPDIDTSAPFKLRAEEILQGKYGLEDGFGGEVLTTSLANEARKEKERVEKKNAASNS